jgi:hypothetical protein
MLLSVSLLTPVPLHSDFDQFGAAQHWKVSWRDAPLDTD